MNSDVVLEQSDQPDGELIVPRHWLFGQVREWWGTDSKALILQGPPGAGKSFAFEQLVSGESQLFPVQASFSCGATPLPPTAQAVLEAIANDLLKLPGYSEQMQELYQRDKRRGITITFDYVAPGARVTGIKNLHFPQRRTAESLIEDLIKEPFRLLARQKKLPPGGVLIIIDGIDGTASGLVEPRLDDLLLSALVDIPGIRLVATRRSGPERPAPSQPHVKVVDLDQDASVGDVLEYLSGRLSGPDPVTTLHLRHLAQVSGTNLLVARYLADNVDLLPLAELETMTSQLRAWDKFYDELLHRQAQQYGGGNPDWEARFRTVLAIVAQGRDTTGLPVSLVERVAERLLGEHAGSATVRDLLRASRSFVEVDVGIGGAQAVRPYHQSFRDYLLSAQGGPRSLGPNDLPAGRVDQVIAAELADRWEHVAAEDPAAVAHGEDLAYLLGHFLEHLAGARGCGQDRSPIRIAGRPHLAYQIAKEHGVPYLLAQLNRLAADAGQNQPELRLLNVVVGLQIRNLTDLPADDLDACFFQQLLAEACVIGAEDLAGDLRTEAELRQLTAFMTVWATGRSDRLPVLHRLDHGQTMVTAVTSLAGDLAASAASDGLVRIWDVASGVRIRVLGEGGYPLRALAVTDRQHLLVTADEEGTGYAWNARSGDQLPPYNARAPIEMITAVPDGDRVMVATPTSVALWDPMADQATSLKVPAAAGRVVAVLAARGSPLAIVCSEGWIGLFHPGSGEPRDHIAGQDPVSCAALSDCGRYLAVGGLDGTVTVRDLNDLHLPPREQAPSGARMSAMGAGLGPRGVALIVGGDREGSVTAWNAANKRQAWHRPAVEGRSAPRRGDAHRGEVTAVAVAGPAGYALTGGRDGLANVWDLRTGERRHHLACGAPITALTSSRDGQYAVAGTSQGEMVVGRVWIADDLQPRHGHDDLVSAVLAVAGGFVTAAQKMVRLWNPADGRVVRKWPHPAEVLCLARAGGHVVTGSADGVARLLSPGDQEPTRVFSAEGVPVTAVAAGGPDTVVVGSDDGTIRAWRDGRVPIVIKTRARVERALVVAAGTKAVSSHRDRSACLWDLSEGTPVAKFDDFLMTVVALDVNADETLVAIGGQDGTVLIVGTRHGEVVTRIQRQPGTLLTCLAFVAGGERLAVGYENGASRVWNVVTSAWLPERLVHPGPVAAITPLGARHFLSGSEDGSVGLWHLPDQEHVELCAHLLVAAQVTCLAASALAEPILVGTVSGDVICVTCR